VRESIESTAIITTTANDFLSKIHHRMPVVLQAANSGPWLDGDGEILGEAANNAPEFRAWPVSRAVNNARNENEDLIAAAGAALT
jgi:putative SOS response-associated peptidase YedK